VPKYSELLTGKIEGMTIGFLEEGFIKCKPNVQGVVKATIPVFEALGAKVEWVSIPQHFEGRILLFH
jgi:Asp-tRNA(Asn)/Glu-tRNA(Gln) amidotransferase A subunit family amidase